MRETDHAKASVVKLVKVLELSVQRVGAFDPEPAADYIPVRGAGAKEVFQVTALADEPEAAM
jgi:hypothetical protein